MKRLRFIQDDSGHWYAIPADRREEFELWVASENSSEFDCFRLNMHPTNYTFVDLDEG